MSIMSKVKSRSFINICLKFNFITIRQEGRINGMVSNLFFVGGSTFLFINHLSHRDEFLQCLIMLNSFCAKGVAKNHLK